MLVTSWFGFFSFLELAFVLVQSAFRQGKQEKSHSAAVHSSGHIHLTTQRAHFEGDILCVVWQAAAQAQKDLLRLCLFRGVLDDVHALTGRGPGIYCSWEILSGGCLNGDVLYRNSPIHERLLTYNHLCDSESCGPNPVKHRFKVGLIHIYTCTKATWKKENNNNFTYFTYEIFIL